MTDTLRATASYPIITDGDPAEVVTGWLETALRRDEIQRFRILEVTHTGNWGVAEVFFTVDVPETWTEGTDGTRDEVARKITTFLNVTFGDSDVEVHGVTAMPNEDEPVPFEVVGEAVASLTEDGQVTITPTHADKDTLFVRLYRELALMEAPEGSALDDLLAEFQEAYDDLVEQPTPETPDIDVAETFAEIVAISTTGMIALADEAEGRLTDAVTRLHSKARALKNLVDAW